MTARDPGANELMMRSLHQAQQQIGRAKLALSNYRASEAESCLIRAQMELVSIEKSLSWPGAVPE